MNVCAWGLWAFTFRRAAEKYALGFILRRAAERVRSLLALGLYFQAHRGKVRRRGLMFRCAAERVRVGPYFQVCQLSVVGGVLPVSI